MRFAGAMLLDRIISDAQGWLAPLSLQRSRFLQATQRRACLTIGFCSVHWSTSRVDRGVGPGSRAFEQMRVDALGSAKTRGILLYTLRHFPDRMIIRVMSRAARLGE